MYGQEEDVQELENYSLSPTSSKFRRRKGCFLSLSLRKQKNEYNLNLQYLNTLLDTNEKYLGQSSTLSKLGWWHTSKMNHTFMLRSLLWPQELHNTTNKAVIMNRSEKTSTAKPFLPRLRSGNKQYVAKIM